jgi:hypothetical protein
MLVPLSLSDSPAVASIWAAALEAMLPSYRESAIICHMSATCQSGGLISLLLTHLVRYTGKRSSKGRRRDLAKVDRHDTPRALDTRLHEANHQH